MASICKYGNIHISTLNKIADDAFNEALKDTALRTLTDSNCGGGRIYKRYATY